MSKKILPISYPMITSWQWHATLFSIIGDDEKAKNWIFSNYIQLRCYNIEEIFTGDEMLLADMMPGSSSLKECPYLLFSLNKGAGRELLRRYSHFHQEDHQSGRICIRSI